MRWQTICEFLLTNFPPPKLGQLTHGLVRTLYRYVATGCGELRKPRIDLRTIWQCDQNRALWRLLEVLSRKANAAAHVLSLEYYHV